MEGMGKAVAPITQVSRVLALCAVSLVSEVMMATPPRSLGASSHVLRYPMRLEWGTSVGNPFSCHHQLFRA